MDSWNTGGFAHSGCNNERTPKLKVTEGKMKAEVTNISLAIWRGEMEGKGEEQSEPRVGR